MRHQRLDEGLRAGDLEDLVLPLLSVDEFESKIDPKAIVIGFYVSDHDAAIDLNRFIQKTPIDILDCDISPAPDQQGFYMVFVEILRNSRMIDNMTSVVSEVSSLTNIKNWKAQIRGKKKLIPFNKEILDQIEPSKTTIDESVMTFLTKSALIDVSITGDHLMMEGTRGQWHGEVIGFGPINETMQLHGLDQKPLTLKFKDIAENERLQTMLGEGWNVSRYGDVDVLQNCHSSDFILLLRS